MQVDNAVCGVANIVSLRSINASLVRPLTAEEKDPVYKAWLERPTSVNPIAQQPNLASILQSQNQPLPSRVPVHTTPDLSPTTQVQFSSGFTSPTSSIDQVHVQTLLSSISSSIAHVQSMVVPDPNDIPLSDVGLSIQSSCEVVVPSSSHESREVDTNFQPKGDTCPGNEDIEKGILQDMKERSQPVETSTTELCNPSTISNHPSERISDISALDLSVITEIQPSSSPTHSISGIVDISPPSKPMSPIHTMTPMNSSTTISLSSQSSSEEEERQRSDDDYALDLIEDIQIPAQLPRRATLVSSVSLCVCKCMCLRAHACMCVVGALGCACVCVRAYMPILSCICDGVRGGSWCS